MQRAVKALMGNRAFRDKRAVRAVKAKGSKEKAFIALCLYSHHRLSCPYGLLTPYGPYGLYQVANRTIQEPAQNLKLKAQNHILNLEIKTKSQIFIPNQ